MAFWGVEVKPEFPHKHRFDHSRGRLHVSQATLGFGQSKKSVFVQCKVGDGNPVLLCSLLPEKTESCSLNIEFEEDDDVTLSVTGGRSVHLTGFYLGPSGRCDHHARDSDSYGEDIDETEDSSDYDSEDEYDDDFIDDDNDFEMLPSPRPNSGVTIEEIVDDEKPKNGTFKDEQPASGTVADEKPANGTVTHEKSASGTVTAKHPKQKPEPSRSESGALLVKNSEKSILESEDEDGFPVSKASKNESTVMNVDSEDKEGKSEKSDSKEKKTDNNSQSTSLKRKIDAIGGSESDRGAAPPAVSAVPSDDGAAESGVKTKKKKKEKNKTANPIQTEERAHGEEVTNVCISNAANNPETILDGKIVEKDEDTPVNNELMEKTPIEKEVVDPIPSSTINAENTGKSKKKKKGKGKDKTLQADADLSAEKEVKAGNDSDSKLPDGEEPAAEAMDQDFSDKAQETNAIILDKNQSEGKKKKKKKNKTNANADGSEPAKEEGGGNVLVENVSEQKSQGFKSKPRTFTNGLAIEDLAIGKPDGKRAHPGNKVSVNYVGKLKKTGEIFDSNVGKRPFKFRLGIGQVIKGWDVGVSGMRVGDKRRLTIPPSMGYGAQGVGKIPPNAWLVFDVELVDVQ